MTKKFLTPVKAIRKKCLDCCVFQPIEVRLCSAVNCPLYPYRHGKRPSTIKKREIAKQFSEKRGAIGENRQ